MNPLRTLCLGLALSGVFNSQPPAAHAQSVEKFYSGRTITVFIGFATGGGYDIYARLITRFMAMHLPGKPTVLPRNMPGGGSRIAAGYVYNVAPKDGTTLATVSQSLPLEQALEQNANFDMTRFTWIGNPLVDNNTVVTWHTSGVRTLEDARAHEVPMGSTGADPSSHYPKVMNALLGTKLNIVTGYPGGNEINLAMERGELGGRGSNSWTTWRATNPEWLRDRKINILAQVGLKKAEDLPDVPLLMDLAANADDHALLRLISTPITIGRPLFSTPQVPADRVKALRDAFDATMKDQEFLDQAEKAHLTIEPLSGEALQKIVAGIAATPAAQLARLAAILK